MTDNGDSVGPTRDAVMTMAEALEVHLMDHPLGYCDECVDVALSALRSLPEQERMAAMGMRPYPCCEHVVFRCSECEPLWIGADRG